MPEERLFFHQAVFLSSFAFLLSRAISSSDTVEKNLSSDKVSSILKTDLISSEMSRKEKGSTNSREGNSYK